MPITLLVRGVGPVPSFKNRKRIVQRENGQRFLATSHDEKAWMTKTTESFRLQLLYGSATDESTIQTAARARSLIASLPHDDCWSAIPRLEVNSELCEPGNEGATIVITKL